MLHQKNNQSGFTLAETLIVVTIIVILSTLILLTLNPLTNIFKGYDTRRKADLHKLQNVLEAYCSDHDAYPPASVLDNCGGNGLQPYLGSIPCDPNTKQPYKNYFVGGSPDAPASYAIYTHIDSSNDKAAEEIPNCPQTFAVHSPNMSDIDLIKGCSGVSLCAKYYGCQNGACVVVGEGTVASCKPNSCDSDCGGIDCGKQSGGVYTNECIPN